MKSTNSESMPEDSVRNIHLLLMSMNKFVYLIYNLSEYSHDKIIVSEKLEQRENKGGKEIETQEERS
jgi:hypothetical protein